MSNGSVRGAGKARAGATDTAMLVWKVIAANPGITRQGIWERVEHSIPEGYALRMYSREQTKKGKLVAEASATNILRARGFVLTNQLNAMRKGGSLAWEGDGRDRRCTVTRELHYRGDPEAIDIGGSKAAEHMAVADALRIFEKMLARANPARKHGPVVCLSLKEYEASVLVGKALRAKGSR